MSQLMELTAYLISSLLIAALGGAMHRARARARENEQQFRAFIENSPAAVFIKDESLRYVFANRAGQRALGNADWQGKSDLEMMPEEAARQIQANDRAVLDGNAPATFDIAIAR